jgi:hypothetical protein
LQFRTLPSSLALSILLAKPQRTTPAAAKTKMSKEEVDVLLTAHDMQRLRAYSRSLVDFHVVRRVAGC